ncbi:MAG: hypothetical protein SNJ67_09880 [Chloracidobacterium sp.]|uniref:Uncharacterized protein n=1 Tax=Chloracidobacterium validum TaxID=2821543 RepID=A0ABX8BGE1_9BACT|nr:hypothetical protein [Chloracidobacterium validum]QUW04663.1 hypothetical protein J8C06_12895 [Chloracidobacterium validum]
MSDSIFEYTASVSPILPNEGAQLAKNFACADPGQKTFIGLPPSIKDAHGLPSATCVVVQFEVNTVARQLTAYIAGGRGGLLRLSTDLMEALRLAPNATATIRLLSREGELPRMELSAVS